MPVAQKQGKSKGRRGKAKDREARAAFARWATGQREGQKAKEIEIAFDIKDVQLAKKIMGGNLFIRANGQSCRITFKKSDLLLKVVQFINGYMRTPKIEALHRLITRLNSKHNTPLLGLDTTPLNYSSWLSGLLDADGNFYLTWKLNKKDMPIGIIYYLRLSPYGRSHSGRGKNKTISEN